MEAEMTQLIVSPTVEGIHREATSRALDHRTYRTILSRGLKTASNVVCDRLRILRERIEYAVDD